MPQSTGAVNFAQWFHPEMLCSDSAMRVSLWRSQAFAIGYWAGATPEPGRRFDLIGPALDLATS
jgi:hypothetical protein